MRRLCGSSKKSSFVSRKIFAALRLIIIQFFSFSLEIVLTKTMISVSSYFYILQAGGTSLLPLTLVFNMIGKFGISSSFAEIFLYAGEVFPVNVRWENSLYQSFIQPGVSTEYSGVCALRPTHIGAPTNFDILKTTAWIKLYVTYAYLSTSKYACL